MMKYLKVYYFAVIFFFISCNDSQPGHETVLDEVVTIYDEIIYEVPDVPRWCDRLGFEGRKINIGDTRLYVETEGDGIPLVLLHGGPGGTHHYFHPWFSRAAGFSRVIYYDQRGCGLSDYRQGEGYTIRQAASDLENLRKALGVEKWVVLGYSYGGLLAQLYATKYPENLAGMVLVSSAISVNIELEPTRQGNFISNEEKTRMQEINEMSGLSKEQILYNRYLNGDWKRQFYFRPSKERLAEFARYEWDHHRDFRPQLIQSVIELDLKDAFLDFHIPTLIFESKWDLTWNTDKPGIIHDQHPEAEMIILKNSGHTPFEDQPDVFFEELKRFISKCAPAMSPDQI